MASPTRSPVPRPLRLYGGPSPHPPIDWSWADQQLTDAGTYWVDPWAPGRPHPRPVWGVWTDTTLYLSIGSRVLRQRLEADPMLTAHLDSGADVVLLEGRVDGESTDAELIASYDAKYDWSYDVEEFGPLAVVTPARVLAWRLGGWAGREGFQATASWSFGP